MVFHLFTVSNVRNHPLRLWAYYWGILRLQCYLLNSISKTRIPQPYERTESGALETMHTFGACLTTAVTDFLSYGIISHYSVIQCAAKYGGCFSSQCRYVCYATRNALVRQCLTLVFKTHTIDIYILNPRNNDSVVCS